MQVQHVSKGKKRPYTQPLEQRAQPTAERMARAGADYERGDTGQITMRDAPLERALGRGAITREQYNAGRKYHHHWYHAGCGEALQSLDVNRVFATDLASFSGMAKTEAQVFHRQQYRAAVQAAGKVGSSVLDKAVCHEMTLEQVGYTLGWGAKPAAIVAATERLKAALDDLCRHWGIG